MSAHQEVKLVVLGGGGVGKSAITMQYLQNHFIWYYDPTIEDSYRKQVQVDESVVLLDILDTAGQEEYSAMRDQYMRHGHAFVLVYSITDRHSFEEVVGLRESIYRGQDKDTTEHVPIILVGNKQDLETERQVTTLEGRELAKSWKAPFFESSAKSRTNIDVIFQEAVRDVDRQQSSAVKKSKKLKRVAKLAALLGVNASKCALV